MEIKYTRLIQIIILYILGIILQLITPGLFVPFGLALLSVFFIIYYKKINLLIFSLFFLFGSCNTYWTIKNQTIPDINSFYNNKHIIAGQISSYPVRTRSFTKFFLQIDKIDNKKGKGNIQVLIKPYIKIEKNSRLSLYGKIKAPSGPANFGEFDSGLYYKKLFVRGTLFVYNHNQVMEIIPIKKHYIQHIITGIRNDILNYLREFYHPVQNSFLNAMIVGETAGIPPFINDIFIRSGTIHLLAISGMNVGLITFMFLMIFLSLRIPRKTSFLLNLILIIIYNLIIGYKAPILRASIMFMAIIGCYFFDRDRNTLNAMALAGLIILIFDPMALTTISFQLSFLATAGIIIFLPVLNGIVNKTVPFKDRITRFILNNLNISLASQILIFPILMFNFKQFSYIAFIANLIAIPLTDIILFISLLGYFFYHLFQPLTVFISGICEFLISLNIYILNFLSKAPLFKFELFDYKLFIMYFMIIFLVFIKTFIKRNIPFFEDRRIRYGFITILLIFFLSGLFFSPKKNNNPENSPEIIFFNIKGGSVLIKSPLNRYILIDSGYEPDTAMHILLFLKRQNIGMIDYLILSNITKARSQGIPGLLKEIPVKQCFMSHYPSKEFLYERILEILNEKKIKHRQLSSGDSLTIDELKLIILNPPLDNIKDLKYNKLEIKNNSLVLKIEYKNRAILLCPDIKKNTVEYLTKNYGKILKADLISVPDMDKDDSVFSDFLNLVRPIYAVINKRYTYFEEKDKKWIIQKLIESNIRYYSTADAGAVKCVLSKDEIKIFASFTDK